ncbi:MAG: UDP-3-O-3-hydroxymyristoyl glucosamine N-acyltransferase, partial [Rhodospirillaceae bacterium]
MAGPFALGELARIGGGELGTGADPARLVRDVAPLETAGPNDISFLDNSKYVAAFVASCAGACIVRPTLANRALPAMALLLTAEPYRAYALIAQAFHPEPPPS